MKKISYIYRIQALCSWNTVHEALQAEWTSDHLYKGETLDKAISAAKARLAEIESGSREDLNIHHLKLCYRFTVIEEVGDDMLL